MIQLYKLDENGFYVEDVILLEGQDAPENCTDIKPPHGLFKGQFVNGVWIEGMAEADIMAKSQKAPLTPFDNLKKQHTDLIFTLMNKGVI